ncbi:hypothetical protein M2277_003327 [Paenibacillus sp. LBL]|nr:hypothetical protein [Paenibacillus sp. LBL]
MRMTILVQGLFYLAGILLSPTYIIMSRGDQAIGRFPSKRVALPQAGLLFATYGMHPLVHPPGGGFQERVNPL